MHSEPLCRLDILPMLNDAARTAAEPEPRVNIREEDLTDVFVKLEQYCL